MLLVALLALCFQGQPASAQTGDEIQLEIISPRDGVQPPLLTNGGWPLTLRLTMDLSLEGRGIIFDAVEEFPRDRNTGWAVFSDPDDCPSFKCSVVNGLLSCPPPGFGAEVDPCGDYSPSSLPPNDEVFLEFTPDVDQPGVKDEAGNLEVGRKLAVQQIPTVPAIDIATKEPVESPVGPTICSAREFKVDLRKVLDDVYNQFGEVSGSAAFTLTNQLDSLSYRIEVARGKTLRQVQIRTGGVTVATWDWPAGTTISEGSLSDSGLTGMTIEELAGMMAVGRVSIYVLDKGWKEALGAWIPASPCSDGYGWGTDEGIPGLVLIADDGVSVIPGLPDFGDTGRRNLAAYLDSIAYSLAEDCQDSDPCKTAVLASMVVPANLFLPTIFIDQAYERACDCVLPDCKAAYREVGGPLETVEGTILQTGWGWLTYDSTIDPTVKIRAFVVNGAAPDQIFDITEDGTIDEEDVVAMGYSLISNPVDIEVELYIQEFDSLSFYFYDFDGNGEAVCGIVTPAGSTSRTPPPR